MYPLVVSTQVLNRANSIVAIGCVRKTPKTVSLRICNQLKISSILYVFHAASEKSQRSSISVTLGKAFIGSARGVIKITWDSLIRFPEQHIASTELREFESISSSPAVPVAVGRNRGADDRSIHHIAAEFYDSP